MVEDVILLFGFTIMQLENQGKFCILGILQSNWRVTGHVAFQFIFLVSSSAYLQPFPEVCIFRCQHIWEASQVLNRSAVGRVTGLPIPLWVLVSFALLLVQFTKLTAAVRLADIAFEELGRSKREEWLAVRPPTTQPPLLPQTTPAAPPHPSKVLSSKK